MLISLAFGATVCGAGLLFLAYLGFRLNRTKDPSWLLTRSSTEGYSGPLLTAAKNMRDIIQHPRRHLIIGITSLVVACGLWIALVFRSLS